MKKNSLKLSMFVLLSLVTSTLFAQKETIAQLELKLTDNGKQWVWYKDDAGKQTSRAETYTFSKTHKVTVVTGPSASSDTKTTTSYAWKITQASTAASAETATTVVNTITIGTTAYVLTYGVDKDHEYILLKPTKPAGSLGNYYYSLMSR